MKSEELKRELLSEHKRDVKLTYINLGIIGTGALIIIGLLVFLFLTIGVSISDAASNAVGETISSTPKYVKFVIPLAILLMLGYGFYAWKKIVNRPKEIEQFVNYVENGTKVVSITETKEYRVKIPLLVVNYHTGAVKKFHVMFEGVNKPFFLPVPFHKTDEIRDLLNENS
jgi:hypothetical protein